METINRKIENTNCEFRIEAFGKKFYASLYINGDFKGKSLWGSKSMKLDELINTINSYNTMYQIKMDYLC